ncbi:MAG: hypothetical protein JSW41_04695 [Candidatus Aenigmatarchaeota archaeon]|nr:MAG: hypothetical protein JSW41_04695 [Candidatus Aenigmarchaeota archaeon]
MRGKETPPVLKLLALVLPIAAIVWISGCTTDGTGIVKGPGVVVLNWEPDFTSVESLDDVQLRLKVQNQGGEQADNVRALITGITFGQDEWGLKTGQSAQVLLEDYLIAPNPRYGTQGETSEFIWYMIAPVLPEGIPQTYSPGIRVFYDYITTAVKPITVVNEDELRHLIDTGGSIPTKPHQYSGGPLSVSVVTGKHIKVGDYGHEFPITIHIENTGGGIPYWGAVRTITYGIPEDEEYWVNLAIDLPPNIVFVTCQEYSGTSTGGGMGVQLWKGKSADVTCKLAIPTPPPVQQEGTIKLYLGYSYAVDRLTSITVKGIPGG